MRRQSLFFPQVVEKVHVFVSDANDEKPEFLSLPYVVNVPEVRNVPFLTSCSTDTLSPDRLIFSGHSYFKYRIAKGAGLVNRAFITATFRKEIIAKC